MRSFKISLPTLISSEPSQRQPSLQRQQSPAGKTVSFSLLMSSPSVPLVRRGSSAIGGTPPRPKGDFVDTVADQRNASANANANNGAKPMLVRQTSDAEQRAAREMWREWRRMMDREARSEARDERADAFYWKHCFREVEMRALNRKKKDVATNKRGALTRLLTRPATNLFLQAVVFPLPLKWLRAREQASAKATAAATATRAWSPRSRRGGNAGRAREPVPGYRAQGVRSQQAPVLASPRQDRERAGPVAPRASVRRGTPEGGRVVGRGAHRAHRLVLTLDRMQEWIHFGRLKEVRGEDDLTQIVFSVKGEERDGPKQRAITFNVPPPFCPPTHLPARPLTLRLAFGPTHLIRRRRRRRRRRRLFSKIVYQGAVRHIGW